MTLTPRPVLHEADSSERPSKYAINFRDAVLASADRMYETKTARKRKALITLPPSPRKKRGISVRRDDAANDITVSGDNEPLPTKPRTPLEPKASKPQLDENLLPIRPSKLNSTLPTTKRTSSQALATGMETPPAKKVLTTMGGSPSVSFSGHGSTNKADAVNGQKGNSAMQHNPDFETFIPVDNEDSEDIFDNDDTYVEDFLEAERNLTVKNVSTSTKISAGDALVSSPLEKSRISPSVKVEPYPQSPIKPFVRRFVPLASSSDTSPTGSIVSPLHRSPTCFRIAEALKHISSAFCTGETSFKALNIEVYAYLHTSTEHDGFISIKLTDIFFPGKPPYLDATARKATLAPAQGQRGAILFSPFLDSLKRNLVRAVVQVTPNSIARSPLATGTPSSPSTPSLVAGMCTLTALKIEGTNWTEIQRVKDILSEKSSSQDASTGKGTDHTRSGNDNGARGAPSQRSRKPTMVVEKNAASPSPAPMSTTIAELPRNGNRKLQS